jgi:Lrp/AsnC family leucine-responsive transcriptional regulator
MTVQAIADRVGLSASPCLRRIRQLEEAGSLPPTAPWSTRRRWACRSRCSSRSSWSGSGPRSWTASATPSAGWPEVMECYLMTGQFDFLLRVVCADLAAYEAFLREKLTQVGRRQPRSSRASRWAR